MKSELSERKKKILKAIVEAHISYGEPVGSKTLANDQQLACSSATIRNEMAELEEMGLLEQPHTSAGRVPSELGYRFYVDSLLEQYRMTTGEIEQIHRTLRRKMGELDQILTDASRLASSITNYTGIAIKPKAPHTAIRRFECTYIDDRHFVLIMIFAGGMVKTKSIHTGFRFDAAALARLGELLNSRLAGLSAKEISLSLIYEMEKAMGEDGAIVQPLIKTVYETMAESDGGEMRVAGVNHLLEYPEYADLDQLRDILGMLERRENILDLLPASAEQDNGVSVYIGRESGLDVMSNSTLIYRTVRQDGKVVGAIGIIGPCRMDYSKVISVINQLTENIDTVINTQDDKQ